MQSNLHMLGFPTSFSQMLEFTALSVSSAFSAFDLSNAGIYSILSASKGQICDKGYEPPTLHALQITW